MPQPKLMEARTADRALPPLALRSAIANATHQVIVRAYGNDPHSGAPRLCLFYAYVGAIVAMVLTDREYAVTVGSLEVMTARPADMPDGKGCSYAMRTDDPATRGLEFHAWFQGQDSATQTVTE